MFKATNNKSHAGTTSVYDDLIARNDLYQLLSQNESSIKLKHNEVIRYMNLLK